MKSAETVLIGATRCNTLLEIHHPCAAVFLRKAEAIDVIADSCQPYLRCLHEVQFTGFFLFPGHGITVLLMHIHAHSIGTIGCRLLIIDPDLTRHAEIQGVGRGIDLQRVMIGYRREIDQDCARVPTCNRTNQLLQVNTFRQGIGIIDLTSYLVNIEFVVTATYVSPIDTVCTALADGMCIPFCRYNAECGNS